MNAILIQKYKKKFNVVIKDDESNIDMRIEKNYYPHVSLYIINNIEKYKEQFFVECNYENCYFSQLVKTLGINKIISLLKTNLQHKYLKHSYILNDNDYDATLVSMRNTEYNKLLRDKRIGFCVCLNLQELKFCKRIFKNEDIHHIILLEHIHAEDAELYGYILKCGYRPFHITPKGIVRANNDNLDKYPILLKNRESLLNDVITVRFD